MGVVQMTATVAVDCGKIPFFTLLGYVDERLLDASLKSPPTFVFDNISIQRMVASHEEYPAEPAPHRWLLDENMAQAAHQDSTDDYAGASTTWLRFSMRPPNDPIELDVDNRPAASIHLSQQRVHEDEYFMLCQTVKLADARSHHTCVKVTWPKEGGVVPGYAVGPVHAPGVVLIQDSCGVDEQLLAHATNIAAQGYRVLVPDSTQGAASLEDVGSGAQYLQAHGSARVGVLGFGTGGELAMAATMQCPEVECGVPFYGAVADASTLAKPLQAHYGELDEELAAPVLEALEAQLQASGAVAQLFRYKKVGRGFLDDLHKDFDALYGQHCQSSADLAWSRVFQFLSSCLKPVAAE